MTNLPNKFRPSSSMDTRNVMKMRLKYGRTDNYNWQSRVEWYPVGYKINHKNIVKQFGKLHYFAHHSPIPLQMKWKKAYNNFFKKHFGSPQMSVSYLNKYSCHKWL